MMIKYPRTRHLEGSRLQPGDEDLDAVPFSSLRGEPLVAEEKLDGANSAISFTDRGELQLQSRGHYLRGGKRERQWDLLKQWSGCHQRGLRDVLGVRYVVFGEWLYAKHTAFYDALPHYFMEFDVFDREAGVFLSTPRRRDLLADLPIRSVPVLEDRCFDSLAELTALIRPSLYKSLRWREVLDEAAGRADLDVDRVLAETDRSELAEGLYLKHERHGEVIGRYKYVRREFLSTILTSESHWQDRPIVPNQLADGVDIFATSL